MPSRASRCATGTCRYRRFSNSVIRRSRRGITQAGVRWNSTRRFTSGWISGTIWIAEAPVPTTATRLPFRSKEWFHLAEWNTGPAKSASPGTSGQGRLGQRPRGADQHVGGELAAGWSAAASAPGSGSQRARITSVPKTR